MVSVEGTPVRVCIRKPKDNFVDCFSPCTFTQVPGMELRHQACTEINCLCLLNWPWFSFLFKQEAQELEKENSAGSRFLMISN